MLSKEKITEVLKILEETYPNAATTLDYRSSFELLVATILSAQCTDKRVNIITKDLFAKYNKPEDFVVLDVKELEKIIQSCGFFRNKSKNIITTSKIILDEFNGQVPQTREELVTLPGVGRKTANVVLSNAFGKDAIAVDTHVFRVSNRIGLANSKGVEQTEMQLMKNIPTEKWSKGHHWLINHGREICKARNPICKECTIQHLCKYYQKALKDGIKKIK